MSDSAFTPLCKYRTKNVDWTPYSDLATLNLDGETVDEVCENLKQSILNAADLTLPHLPPYKPRPLVPWWRPACREALRLRNRAWRKFDRSPTESNHINYKKYRALARQEIRAAKRASWDAFVSTITRDTPVSLIWEFIRRIHGKGIKRPYYLLIDNVITDDPHAIAEAIALHFESVSADSNYSEDYLFHREQTQTPLDFSSAALLPYNADFTIGELLFVLGKVRGSSAGPDGIKYEMLQNLSAVNKISLLQFFNKIWSSQQFPADWANAVTIPIIKPGKDPKLATSYRPIALTNVLCKVMERLVNRRLLRYLEEHGVLSDNQFGFRKGRSALHNLLLLEHDVQKSLASNDFTTAAFLDIEKAFDMCPRWGILKCLHDMGLKGNLPIFILNFIKIRFFVVKVGGAFSFQHCQVNGVPQGSVLSPPFLLF